jgi:transposase
MELDGIGLLLGIQPPWVLKNIAVQNKNQVIDVFIDFEVGTRFYCPCCGELKPVYDSYIKRVRYLDLFDFRCYLNIKTPRIDCGRDGIKTVHSDPWSRKGSHYSFKFESLIMRLCKEMSMTAVSRELGEPDNNLWRIFHHWTKKEIVDKFDFSEVKRVCVDETAIKRGHKYVSIFTDYDTGKVLFVTEGRKKEVFSLFYGWLWDKGGYPGNIELFSMDMSVSYQAGQQENFGNSEVVFDRFHIKKGINKAVNDVRIEELKTVDSLKKSKYIWLKNEKKLTEIQKEKLNNFLEDSTLKTTFAYQIKNKFDQLWNVQPLAIRDLMDNWIEQALALNLKPINRFVKTVLNHYNGIIKSIETGISNAVSEGLNSVMQLARSRARGFRNYDNFIAMIYYLGNG